MGKNSEGEMMEPPRVLWPDRSRGLPPITSNMARAMIPPKALKNNSLFALLYEIDLDLAEQSRAQGCPIAGGRCTGPTTPESLGAAPLICQRLLNCD